jgi:hypothetical protein
VAVLTTVPLEYAATIGSSGYRCGECDAFAPSKRFSKGSDIIVPIYKLDKLRISVNASYDNAPPLLLFFPVAYPYVALIFLWLL